MSNRRHTVNFDPRPPRWIAVVRSLRAGLRAMAGPGLPLSFQQADAGLHRCPDCGRDHVCPVEWEAADDEHWAIALRCGDCGLWRDVLATNGEASVYDVVLDRHQRTIERALARLDAERMADELERFVRALSEDLIDATDFAR
jgi:hypothetical protein